MRSSFVAALPVTPHHQQNVSTQCCATSPTHEKCQVRNKIHKRRPQMLRTALTDTRSGKLHWQRASEALWSSLGLSGAIWESTRKYTTIVGVYEVRVKILLIVIVCKRVQLLVRWRVVVSGAVRSTASSHRVVTVFTFTSMTTEEDSILQDANHRVWRHMRSQARSTPPQFH